MNEWINEWMKQNYFIYLRSGTLIMCPYILYVTVNTYCKLTDATLTSAQMQSVSVLLCFL